MSIVRRRIRCRGRSRVYSLLRLDLWSGRLGICSHLWVVFCYFRCILLGLFHLNMLRIGLYIFRRYFLGILVFRSILCYIHKYLCFCWVFLLDRINNLWNHRLHILNEDNFSISLHHRSNYHYSHMMYYLFCLLDFYNLGKIKVNKIILYIVGTWAFRFIAFLAGVGTW